MNKNLPLESLRGIAALAVVLFHFRFTTPLVDNPLIRNAYVMVDFFFALSGFVIAMNYQNRIEHFSDVVGFQLRRFWRLYPLHLATLLFFVLRDVRFSISELTHGNPSPPMLHGEYIPKLLHNLMLTQALFVDHLSFNWPSWSISTEFYTYVLFALTLLAFKRRRVPVYLLIICGACLINWYWGHGLRSSSGLGIVRCIYSFYLGALTWHLSQHSPRTRKSLIPACLLLLSLIAVMTLTESPVEMFIPLIFCITIANVAALHETSRLRQLLSHRVLVYLGTISYSLYLTHAIVIVIFLALISRLGNIPMIKDQAGYIIYNTSPINGTLIILLGLGLTIGLSHLTYRLIEDRLRHGLRKKQPRQTTPPSDSV